MAIALQPDVLLLDEPTSALDAKTTMAVEKTVLDRKLTAVWISHDAGQIDRIATNRLMLA